MIGDIKSHSSKPCLERILESLQQLDKLLERAISLARTTYGTESAVDPYRGLYINREDIERSLGRKPGTSPLDSKVIDLEEFFAEELTEASNVTLLQQAFSLSLFDLALVSIALAPEIDLRYERIYAYLQDDVTRKLPTVDLALNLLCASASEKLARRIHFASNAPLIRQGLLHLIPDSNQTEPSLLAHYLKLDEQIIHFLLGEEELDRRLSGFSQLCKPRYFIENLPLNPEIKQSLTTLTWQASQTQQPLCLYFYGLQGVEKRRTAEAIAHHLGVSFLDVDLVLAIGSNTDLESVLKLLLREIKCRNAIIYLPGFDELLSKEKAIARQLLSILSESKAIAILAGKQPWQPSIAGMNEIIPVSFPLPDFARRRFYWQTDLTEVGIILEDRELDALSDRFRLTPDQIESAIATACNQSRWLAATRPFHEETEKIEQSKIQISDLFAAARMQSGQDLAALARKIAPKYVWEDLILPLDRLAQLQEICDQAKYRPVVYGKWGFDRKLSLGKGLNVLFSGPPGTGKTMAAEVIANELQIDLYKIDLSQVVSKYIGETEKNLDRIFSAAQTANAILFFDEADALFGKRSEVKNAHDRYANIEVGYLLQKMEEYEGVAILATNFRQNIDEAFMRRTQVIVEFPFPDLESRKLIWEVVFPKEAPIGKDVDFDFLAREVKLAGGNIKNIALAAAFYAASEDEAIRMPHLIKAVSREHQKLGRTWHMGVPPGGA